MRKVKVNTLYKHFKGSYAYVIALAKHSETNEDLVIYYCFNNSDTNHKNGIYARPFNMFISKVDNKKYPNVKQEYRFEEVI